MCLITIKKKNVAQAEKFELFVLKLSPPKGPYASISTDSTLKRK